MAKAGSEKLRIPFIFAAMDTLFWIVYITWFVSEVVLNRMLRSTGTDKPGRDRHSLTLIWITVIVTIAVSVILAPRTAFVMYAHPAFLYLGIALIILGIILRIAAVVSLGKYFTVDVTIRQGHRLKEDGMYTYIRHPSYAASLLSFTGFGISLNNWLSLLLMVSAILSVFIYRMNIEESVLTEQFGDEYIQYKRRTKRIIPFIY